MFEEGEGEVSLTRVVTFLSLIFSFIIAIIGLYKNVDLNQLSVLVGSFLGPSLMAKTVSKFAEKEVSSEQRTDGK